ncbi:proteasome assembly chaperone family protein [Saliphagus sp. LR7]|uniref:proteasome assembly chaperone family protein n=1 Tax=Saliphagus sp. LR7 TaxID=2282654 RepID=UPI000DF80924|nr:PAC2 family protein [Saliphagus sp. LR7]
MSHSTFDVTADGEPAADVLVVGLSSPGFAGVTATDYLTRHLPSEEVGHVSPAEFPTITPFAEGRPRNPTRIYDIEDTALAAVVGELFVPVPAAPAFVDSLLSWVEEAGISEIVVPYGIPFPHGPEEHDVFTVATDAFREHRLEGSGFDGLRGGVLDGPVGELVARSMNDAAPPTGALLTPVHSPGPDLEAAIRLVDALESLYGVDVDEGELRRQSRELQEYYATLADRMNAIEEGSRDYPEDRSYM